MSITNVAARYQAVQVNTCSPAQLVAMLLDGAIRFADEAGAAIDAKDRARVGERINRCHQVIEALAATLDREQAPELCDNLSGLYAFCMGKLLQANLEQNRQHLTEIAGLLAPLRDAWWKVARGG